MKLHGRTGYETIRSDLQPNRESRPLHRRRLYIEPFGIYRPLTPQCKDRLEGVLDQAEREINSTVLSWKSGRALERHKDMGVTFVKRQQVARAMAHGSIRRGFDFGQMTRSIATEAILKPGTVEVPVDFMTWKGIGQATLAVATSEYELIEQTDVLAKILHATNAEVAAVDAPDHVSLFRYGSRKDVVGTKGLDESQRAEISEVVAGYLGAAGISELELGPIVVGVSYSQPHPLLRGVN